MKRATRNAAIVIIAVAFVGVLASLLSPILNREESLGLDMLYSLRGPVAPPDKVIVVAISQEAAAALGLAEALRYEDDLTGWPRSLHASLVDVLAAAGVSVIAFDIHFEKQQDEINDSRFVSAIRDAGNVLLFDLAERNVELPPDEASGPPVEVIRDVLIHPAEEYEAAALATAPFLLPKIPAQVSQYWTFLPSAHDVPTLPVLAFGVYAREAQERLVSELVQARPELAGQLHGNDPADVMRELRRILRDDTALADGIAAEPGDRQVLLDLYTGPDTRYLNFYGRPRTITTVSFDEVLNQGPDPALPWRGAMVLVGYSDRTQPAQDDAFLTFFSQQRSGLDLSGVEIAATALANLLEGRAMTALPLGLNALIALVVGALFGASFLLRSVAASVATLALLLLAYTFIAHLQFELASVWWPMVVPILIQAPLALTLGLALRYASAEGRHVALSRGASRYLPPELVARMAEGSEAAAHASELLDGICVATDIESFTAYAERLRPRDLETALNAYYEELFGVVNRNGGLVTDIVGDSMVAVWRGPVGDGERAARPAQAALEIRDLLSSPDSAFPRTRVGLSAGQFMLGAVGAREHLEYRAIGDMVNSAARIQALNKRLGTTVLAAIDAMPDEGVCYRQVGTFQLAGKQNLLEICEPLVFGAPASERMRELVERFTAALRRFRQGQLQVAMEDFEAILRDYPDDGPSRFYVEYIRSSREAADGGFCDSVIRLTQ